MSSKCSLGSSCKIVKVMSQNGAKEQNQPAHTHSGTRALEERVCVCVCV